MQAIDAVALIQRLEQFVLGDDADAMTEAQVNAALGLLDRALPSLVEVLVSASEGRRVSVRVTPE